MRRSSLNHTYRLVWSEQQGAYVAVSELTSARGKAGRAGRAFVVALGSVFSMSGLAADITVAPGSGGTALASAPNGVPVLNIANPNGAGLSHNKFLDYNVTSQGLVLNNSMAEVQSQLAGKLAGNTNLNAQANVILNEVVSTNRSTLAGFTEVAGGRADVVVANPYGITCNGCGFINTDRVTLTTGTPNFAGNGALTGFTVNQGDIAIGGTGLDASSQSKLDIVTRSFSLNGQLNAKDLMVILGSNTWNYDTRTATANASSGAAPSFSFDSTLLGGMYANRIFVQSTEAGVGVRMLGDSAATAGDFTIASSGKLLIKSTLSSSGNLTAGAGGGTSDALTLEDAQLSAGQNLSLSASGGAAITGGLLVAGGDLSGTFDSLVDTGDSASITYNNSRYATNSVNLNVTGAATLGGTSWGAGAGLTGSVGSLSTGSAETLYAGTALAFTATTGDLALGKAAVRAGGDIGLTATTGAIRTEADANQGVLSTNGNITVTAGNGLDNAGSLSASSGGVTLRVDGSIVNSGALHAGGNLDIADKNAAATESITNSGTLFADGEIAAKASTVSNTGGIQGTAGTSLAATSLTNSGTLIASNTAGKSGTFTLASLDNSGALQSTEDITLNMSGTLTNTGKLLAGGNLSVNAGSSALAISNTGAGYIEAGNALNMTGANASFSTQSGTLHGNTIDLTLSTLNNSGLVQSETSMGYAFGGALVNSGTLLAKTTMTGSSASLDNSGTMQANQGGTISATGLVNNTGNMILSAGTSYTGTINAGTLSNSAGAVIESGHNLGLNISGATLDNAGNILADDDLGIHSTGSGLTVTNSNGGYIQAGSNVVQSGNSVGTLTVDGTAVTVDNNSGGYLIGDTLAFTAASFGNAGTVIGGAGDDAMTVSVAMNNSGVMSLGAGNATAATGSLSNSGTLQSDGNLAVSASSTSSNSGTLLAGHNLTFTDTSASAGFTLTNTGYLQSGSASGDTLTLGGTALTVLNDAGGVIYGDTLRITAASLTNNNWMQGLSGSTINLGTGALNNTGTLIVATASGGTGTITAGRITNSGTLESLATTDTVNFADSDPEAMRFNFTSTDGLVNTGNVLSNGSLYMTGATGTEAFDVSNTGLMQTGGYLVVKKDPSGAKAGTFTIGSTGKVRAYSMLMQTTALDLQDDGTSGAGLYVSKIGQAYVTDLTMSGSHTKIIAGYSGDTGAYLAQQTPYFRIYSDNPFTNNGVIASEVCLDLNMHGGTTVNNGTILAGYLLQYEDFSTSGGNFINNGTLYSGGSLNIGAVPGAASSFTNTGTTSGPLGTVEADGNIAISMGDFVNNSTIQAGGDITVSTYYGRNFTNASLAPATYGAKIIANGTLTINNVGTGLNDGGILSGSSVILGGANITMSTFTNDIRGNSAYGIFFNTATVSDFLSFTNNGADVQNGVSQGTPGASSTTASSGTGIASTSLTAGGSGTSSIAVSGSGSGTSVITSTTSSGGTVTLSINGLTVTLPTAPNGRFLTNPNPTARYLIETNPLFLNYNYTVSSDVLAAQLGLDPDSILRRLGDAAYENYLISNQLVSLTHRSMLDGYNDQNAMVYDLFTSAATQSKELGLVWGQPLSSAQTVNLKKDIVWMVETEVAGVKVLAPVVYLSAETRAAVQNGALAGGNLAMNVGTFNNSGSTVSVNNASITTRGDINNQAGTIKSRNLELTSTNGGLNNAGGNIIAKGDLQVTTGKDINNAGGLIAAAGVAQLTAKGDINNAGGNMVAHDIALTSTAGGINNAGGNVSGHDVGLTSTAGSINNAGGTIASQGLAILEAHKDINNTGGQVSGADVSLTATTGAVHNAGGSLQGSKSLELTSAADIATSGGTLKTKDLSLTSTEGKVNLSGVNTNAAKSDPNRLEGLSVSSKKDIVNKDNTISVDRLSLTSTGGSIVNDRGTIEGSKSLALTAKKDIDNEGGQIKGGDISLRTEQGSITSKTLTKDGQITDKASIDASGSLYMNSGKDINITGSNVSAKGNAVLNAAADVNINNVVETSSTHQSGQFGRTKTTMDQTQEKIVGSNVSAGENLVVSAGGNANIIASNLSSEKATLLKAGKDIVIDTAVATTDTTKTSKTSGIFRSSSSKEHTVETHNVGSTIKTGGDLVITSGGNTTIAGSDVNAGGDLYAQTGGDFNVIARQDTVTSHTETTKSGLGVGGGLWGKSKTVTDDASSTNKGSTITVGGGNPVADDSVNTNDARVTEKPLPGKGQNALAQQGAASQDEGADSKGNLVIKSGHDINIVGSNIDASGSAALDAGHDLNVLAGKDTSTSKSHTETETVFAFGSSSSTEKSASTDVNHTSTSGSAQASASASADNHDSMNFYQKKVIDTNSSSTTSVGSSLNVGGNLRASAGNTLTVKGSDINAGGDAALKAKEIKILAGQNESTSTTKTKTDTFGIFVDNSASAGAKAGVEARGETPSASASTNAEAAAGTTVTIGGRHETSSNSDYALTNTGSKISSGGNMTISADNDATFQGAAVSAGGDLDVKAKNINNLAAQDVQLSQSHETSLTSGVFVTANGKVTGDANAKGGLTMPNAAASASAEARADQGVGVRTGYEEKTENSGSVTNVVNTFQAGGNLTRKATDTIHDQGTQLEAGGNIEQSATTLVEDAVHDSSFSKSHSLENEARVGVFLQEEAKAEAGAGVNATTPGNGDTKAPAKTVNGANVTPKLSGGIRVTNDFSTSSDNTSTTTAVTTSYKAGGNIVSKTTGKSTFVGTNMEAGKDIALSAQSIDFQAATDSRSQTLGDKSNATKVDVDIMNKKVDASTDYRQQDLSGTSTTAQVGSLSAKGSITVKTEGDARFEGTQIEANKDVNVTSTNGNVIFDAAKSVANVSSKGGSGGAEVSVGADKDWEARVNAGAQVSDSKTVKNTVASIKSGGNVNVNAGKDVALTGTQIGAGGDANVSAGGKVSMLEAKDTVREKADGFNVSVGASPDAQTAGFQVTVKDIDKQTGNVVSIKSGGTTKVSGQSLVNQESDLQGAQVEKQGTEQNLKRTNINKSVDVAIGAEFSHKKEEKPGTTQDPNKTTSTTQDPNKTTSTTQDPNKTTSTTQDPNKTTSTTQDPNNTASTAQDPNKTTSTAQDPNKTTSTTQDPNKTTSTTQDPNKTASTTQDPNKTTSTAQDPNKTTSTTQDPNKTTSTTQDPNKTASTAQDPNKTTSTTNSSNTSKLTKLQDAKKTLDDKSKTVGDDNLSNTSTIFDASEGEVKVFKTLKLKGSDSSNTLETKEVNQLTASQGNAVAQTKLMKAVDMPTLPPGAAVTVTTGDGKALPAWAKFDPMTGMLSGTPPAGFKGALEVVIQVPQAGGGTREIRTTLGQ